MIKLLIIRKHNGVVMHVDSSEDWGWNAQQLRSKMSQHVGKNAFEKAYIEIFHYDTKESIYYHTKEELAKHER
ncbi:hypothetical protein [Bacillus phage DZ1]|uniref:Uncharacterized protein n=1 Tax=Bacillus phage DZ1 TaxID=3075862 RepID=A0AA96IXU1_9CAUD|nr:hypothetical protein [Bacillus phage DZ1]